MNWKSKITWIQIISFVITLLGALQPAFPEAVVYLSLIVNLLTVILRQLQGVEVKLGGKRVRM